jgi:hypothetical protein
MNFKHSYMVVTTDFQLEPVLQQYQKTYPNGQFTSFDIVFKTENEHGEGQWTYIVVFVPSKPTPREIPSFSDFLKSYCTLEDKTAVASIVNSVFPRLDKPHGSHLFGNAKRSV